MKYSKQILEAINRGIQLALDDYEDDNQLSSKSNIIKNTNSKELWKLHNSYVNLGLPSGTLWCKYNLGCDWNKLNNDPEHTKPEDWYGNYYAWGEISPKNNFSQETYKFGTDDEDILTKYNNKEQVELELVDDAAYNDPKYPCVFKMPTKKQLEELVNYTDSKWISGEGRNLYLRITGLSGMLFTSKINGNQLFIPASGYYNDYNLKLTGKRGFLWTTSLFQPWLLKNSWFIKTVFTYACNLSFDKYEINQSLNVRWQGLSIRPIINR